MMKIVATLILSFGFAVSPLRAAEVSSGAVVPQPRVRLQPSAQGYIARVEPSEKKAVPTTMDKVVVAESKLPPVPRRDEGHEPRRFSPLRGGVMASGRTGSWPIEVGLWPWRDVFVDEARFKPQQARVDFEMVRVKW